MKYSEFFIPTLKEVPADAEVVSHQLMLRAGMIRKVAAGIYNYLPLGLRSIRKLEKIVREEMDRAGAIEVLMPMVTPADLWIESGRWQQYGKELLRLKDRKDTEFCLGPTHEEVVTDIARRELRSYRQLPVNFYQIQTKFRDEIRPRFGLMRGREFIMKDAYSFDLDEAGADASYEKMYQAYRRIFNRCGLRFRAVEADTGNIGGTSSHEFMVLAESGEDDIASCNSCDYAANVEKAELNAPAASAAAKPSQELGLVHTPGVKSIQDVAAFLKVPVSSTVKALVVDTDAGDTVMVLLRGDHELNEVKLCRFLGCNEIAFSSEEKVEAIIGAPLGFLGPVNCPITVVADHGVRGMCDFACGANKVDYHFLGANLGRDFPQPQYADLRQAQGGDACPRCDGQLEIWRGIEVGHVFKLGKKYSTAMRATVQDDQGSDVELFMGCYGIGIGRTLAAAIEQNHDESGIVFPVPLAPFQVVVTMVNPNDEAVRAAAEKVYAELGAAGVEVLLDDRDERPGIKFKDADLVGIPWRITVGAKALSAGDLELQTRSTGNRELFPASDIAEIVTARVRAALEEVEHA